MYNIKNDINTLIIFIIYVLTTYLILCNSINILYAQNEINSSLRFKIKILDDKNLIDNVICTKIDHNDQILTKMCKDGKLDLKLNYIGDYILILKKSGYIPNLIYISTKMDPNDIKDVWDINESKIKLTKKNQLKSEWEQDIKLIKYQWDNNLAMFTFRYIYISDNDKEMILESIYSRNLDKVKKLTHNIIAHHNYVKVSKYTRDSLHKVINLREGELKIYRKYIIDLKENEDILKKSFLISKSIEDQHFFQSIKDQDLRFKEEIKSWRFTINRIEDEMRFTLSKIDRLGHQKSYIDLYKSIIDLKRLISKNKAEYKTDSLEILIKNAELELDLEKTKKEYRKALNGYKESKKIYYSLLDDASEKVKEDLNKTEEKKSEPTPLQTPTTITYNSIIPKKIDNEDMFVDTYKYSDPYKQKTKVKELPPVENNRIQTKSIEKEPIVNKEPGTVYKPPTQSINQAHKPATREKAFNVPLIEPVLDENMVEQFIKDKIKEFNISDIYLSDTIFNIKLEQGHQYIKIPMTFEDNKYFITKKISKSLDNLVKFLQKNYTLDIEIRGYSDVGFINEEQKTLAARRAIAVKKYLISKGVNKYRLTPVPFPTTVDEISRYSKIKNRFTHDLEFRIKASSNSEGVLLKQLKQDLLDGKFISSPESVLSVYRHELRSFEKKWMAERKKLIDEEYIEPSAVDVVNKALPKVKEISPETKKENEEIDIARQIEKQIEADLSKAEDEFTSNIDNTSFDDEFDVAEDNDDEVTFDDLDDIDLDDEEDFFNSKDDEEDDFEIDDSEDFDFQKELFLKKRNQKLLIRSPPKWKTGGSFAFTWFYGDISRSIMPWLETRASLGLDVIKPISKVLEIQGNITNGFISGKNKRINVGMDAPSGVYFNTSILDASINLNFNITKLFIDEHNDLFDKIQLYASFGHGLVKFNTTLKMIHTDEQILQYGKGVSGKTTEMFTPMGLSVHHILNRNIDLAYSFIMKSVNTDKMDGWMEVGSSRDKYILYSVTLLYKIREKFLVRTIDKMKPSNL